MPCSAIIREISTCSRRIYIERDPQQDIVQRMRDLRVLSHKKDVSIISHHGSANPKEKEAKKVSQKGSRKQGILNQHNQISYELTETEATYIVPTQFCTSWGPRAEICRQLPPPPTLKLSAVWKTNFCFFQGSFTRNTKSTTNQSAENKCLLRA